MGKVARITVLGALLGSLAATGCRAGTEQARDPDPTPARPSASPPAPPLFPELPPVATADPARRHSQMVAIPTRLSLTRTPAGIEVRWPASPRESLELSVGERMIVGVETRLALRSTDVPPVEYDTTSLGSGALDPADMTLLSPTSATPPRFVHASIVIFETDVPPQHHWSPRSGRYRVLAERSLVAPVP